MSIMFITRQKLTDEPEVSRCLKCIDEIDDLETWNPLSLSQKLWQKQQEIVKLQEIATTTSQNCGDTLKRLREYF